MGVVSRLSGGLDRARDAVVSVVKTGYERITLPKSSGETIVVNLTPPPSGFLPCLAVHFTGGS